jgi:hypothetical protein
LNGEVGGSAALDSYAEMKKVFESIGVDDPYGARKVKKLRTGRKLRFSSQREISWSPLTPPRLPRKGNKERGFRLKGKKISLTSRWGR